MRLGLYGGSFDPPHKGHVHVARTAIEVLGLDELLFIPAARSPFKEAPTIAPDAARVAMLEACVGEVPGARLWLGELEAGGVSYTIETVRLLRAAFPAAELFWIMGADQLLSLRKWREADALLELVVLAAVTRPGYPLDLPEGLSGARVRLVECAGVDVSSTGLRRALAAGEYVSALLPEAVEAIIRKLDLYSTVSQHDDI